MFAVAAVSLRVVAQVVVAVVKEPPGAVCRAGRRARRSARRAGRKGCARCGSCSPTMPPCFPRQ
eukprot:3746390-Lingulodinium_polyedra.AAC.1